MPHYILLLHDSGTLPASLSPDEIQAIIERYVAWRGRISKGREVSGHKLRDGQGRVMRGAGASATVTDGPYAEAREVIGGLFIVSADSYEEVVELCRDCPHLEFGAIEIRETQPTS